MEDLKRAAGTLIGTLIEMISDTMNPIKIYGQCFARYGRLLRVVRCENLIIISKITTHTKAILLQHI